MGIYFWRGLNLEFGVRSQESGVKYKGFLDVINKSYLSYMFLSKAVPISFSLVVASFIMALLSKLLQWDNLFFLLTIQLIIQYFFAFAVIYEIQQSNNLNKDEKSRWKTNLLLMPLPFGLIYLLKIRRGQLKTN